MAHESTGVSAMGMACGISGTDMVAVALFGGSGTGAVGEQPARNAMPDTSSHVPTAKERRDNLGFMVSAIPDVYSSALPLEFTAAARATVLHAEAVNSNGGKLLF